MEQNLGQIIHKLAERVGLILCLGLLWWVAVKLADFPPYLLPDPLRVMNSLYANAGLLSYHGAVTFGEMIAGLMLGASIAIIMALLLVMVPWLARFALPVFIGSQALPVFALAPLLTLWFGFGYGSKIVMASLIIYFPIIRSFYDGLMQTKPQHLQAATSLGATPFALMWAVRIPAALPQLASGLKIAASVTPIGVIVGEWVGGSKGLGFLMLHANGKMQTDLMFASLIIILCLGLGLHHFIIKLCNHLPLLFRKLFDMV
ncbi:MAG: ABC transporter permease [Alphaproteobacteria bacterium]